MRIGFGYDVHRLEKGYPLCIGGIVVPYSRGSVGHSDADVLIHAIIDALLGASNLRDIGFQYPDSDAKYKNIDSKLLLEQTMYKIAEKNYQIVNIDTTICLQQPKIGVHIPAMQQTLADVMGVSPDQVSIKATTTEKLGFVGEGLGISAYAVALLNKQ